MKRILITLLVVFSMANANAATKTLTSGAGWSDFNYYFTGDVWEDNFTFTITEASILTVTDFRKAGDIFEVISNGVSLGLTSLVNVSTDFTNDRDFAAADARWSSGAFNFSAGTYVISGLADFAIGDGAGAIRLDSGVPEIPVPAALFLFAPALLGFLGLRRKSSV